MGPCSLHSHLLCSSYYTLYTWYDMLCCTSICIYYTIYTWYEMLCFTCICMLCLLACVYVGLNRVSRRELVIVEHLAVRSFSWGEHNLTPSAHWGVGDCVWLHPTEYSWTRSADWGVGIVFGYILWNTCGRFSFGDLCWRGAAGYTVCTKLNLYDVLCMAWMWYSSKMSHVCDNYWF